MTGAELLAMLKNEPNGPSADFETWKRMVEALDSAVLLLPAEQEKVRRVVGAGVHDKAQVAEALGLLSPTESDA